MNAKILKSKPAVIIALIVIIGGGYYWRKSSNSGSTAVQYKTAPAKKGMLVTSVSGSGNVVVDQSVNIDPTITGTVYNLAVNIGDQVKKGQLLFEIINNDLNVSTAKSTASLQQAQNSVDSAKVSVEQAKADYDSAKHSSTSTHKQKDVLKDKIKIAEAGVTAAEKSLAATQADYSNQFANAAKRQVVSPMNGTVNAVNIKNGDDLSKLSSGSSRQVPMIIGDLGTMKAQVQINEVDVPNVQIGQKVTMTFNSVAGLTLSGKVEKMDSLGTITQSVVSYNAKIGFDNLDSRIKPGMSVSASIITGVKQDVIMVPNSAVKTRGNENYVEVLNSGQTTPKQVTVQVGSVNNTDTEIVSGLNAGDLVVTRTINAGTSNNAANTTRPSGSGGGVRIPGLGGGGRPD